MNKSRSFDRAAHFYDQTRLIPEPILKHGIPALLDLIGPEARVLEAGAGTGRISIPLLQHGVHWIGFDLSSQMLERLQGKLRSAPLVRADATSLPFSASQFDILLTVHVMHLIPPWREVLREFQRVLKTGGAYLQVSTGAEVGPSISGRIRDYWRSWMAAHGVNAGHPGVQERETLLQELRSLGANLSEVEAVRYSESFLLRERLDRFASRVFSETWDIPDPLFEESMSDLRAWALEEFGSLDYEIKDEVRFLIDIARFA